MKRVLSCFLAVILLAGAIPLFTAAVESERDVIHFEDGSFAVIEIASNDARASASKNGSKQYTYYNSSNEAQWKAVLSAVFTYDGSSASCTSSDVSVTIFDSSWNVVSKSSGKSGNTATGSVTMGKKSAGVTVAKVPVNLSLSCDKNGNLS